MPAGSNQGFSSQDRVGAAGPNRQGSSSRPVSYSYRNAPFNTNELFIARGAIADTGTQEYRTYVVSSNAKALASEVRAGYSSKAVMSLDGLLRPVSLSGDGDLPPMVVPATGYGEARTGPSDSYPPLTILPTGSGDSTQSYNLLLDNQHLQPFVNPWVGHYGSHSGHDIDIVGKGSGLGNVHASTYIEKQTDVSGAYADDYRFLALRGPLMLQQWGTDTNGKPVPNAVDDPSGCRLGEFSTTGLRDEFMPQWLTRSDCWPMAPIDLRLDRKRGMWVAPQFTLVKGELLEDLSPTGSASGKVVEGQPIYDYSGNLVEFDNSAFSVYDFVEESTSSGTRFFGWYDSYADKIYKIGGGGGSSPWIRFRFSNVLTKSAESTNGIIIEKWGGGPNEVGDEVTLYNLERFPGGTYAWDGAVNTVGYATYDSVNKEGWRIINLDCSTAPTITDDCTYCVAGTTPRTFRITLNNVSNDVCTVCDTNIDGTYFVSQSGSNTCVYHSSYNAGNCEAQSIKLTLSADGSNTQAEVFLVYLSSGGATHTITWAGGLGATTGLNCNLIDETLAYSTQGGGDCNGIGSVAVITAV